MIQTHERQLVLDQLSSSEARILSLVANLTPAQWHYHESPERWSIADNIEHLILFEHFITGVIAQKLATSAEPEKKPQAVAKEPLVLGLANARHTQFNSREVNLPTGRWPDTKELIAKLRTARAGTLAFASETHANLRDHFFAHVAFGDLDCYQWLLLLGQHSFRHALQIEQIKADSAYPAQ